MANEPISEPRRPRVALRAFLAVLLAVLIVAGAVVGFLEWTVRSGEGDGSVELAAAARAQEALMQQRLESIGLAAESVAGAAGLAEELTGAEDPGTRLEPMLRDLLDNRGFDLAVIAGPGGEAVAFAGSDQEIGEALIGSPAAVGALGEGRARGVWNRAGRLYLVAAHRIERDFETLGLVAVAMPVDRSLALEARGLSRAEVMILIPTSGGGAESVASTLGRDGSAGALPALREAGLLERALREGRAATSDSLRSGGRTYGARVAPLAGARGGVQGVLVTLIERMSAAPLVRTVQAVAAGAGLVALALGGLVAWLAGRGARKPIDEVVAAAAQARTGDLAAAARFAIPAALAQVFSDLAERRSLEAAVAETGRRSGGVAGAVSAERRRGAVLVVEMPRYARLGPDDEPREVSERLGRDLVRVRRAVSARGGRVEAGLGHRTLGSFGGDHPEAAALVAGAEILRTLSEPENAFDDPVPPRVALAAGEMIRGGSDSARTVTGLPVQQVESLLREASSGDLILSKGVHQAVQDDLASGGVELTPQRGLLIPQPVYLLDAERASSAARVLTRTLDEARRTGGRGEAGSELAALAPGTVVADRFGLTERLAGGRTSVVFLAQDRQSDTVVALKALRRELLLDLAPLEAFDSEIRGALRVVHPSVARVMDLGVSGGVPFVASEYVDGPPLARVLASQRLLAPPGALRLARHVAAGLGAIHDAGLAHGDLRPETIILEPRGSARIIDLAVALLFPPPGTDPAADRALGTPRYMAPERLQGGLPTAAADIWAVGVLLAEVFTGRPLYGPATERPGEDGWEGARERVLSGPREVPDPTELPEGLAPVLERCLARAPEERYAAGGELVEALRPIRAELVR